VSRLHHLPFAALLILVPASTVVRTQTDFTASVDLVPMDVCVTDRSGRPSQVRPDELMVLDNGIPQ